MSSHTLEHTTEIHTARSRTTQSHILESHANPYADFLSTQIFSKNQLEILNEVNETRLDFAPLQSAKTMILPPKIAVVGSGEIMEEFLDTLSVFATQQGLEDTEIFSVLPESFITLNGSLGHFHLLYTQDSQTLSLEVAQVVFFTNFANVQHSKGVHWVNEYHSSKELLESLARFIGAYTYTSPIRLTPSLCEFWHRRPKRGADEGYCHKCSDVCQSYGVFRNDQKGEIALSSPDCIACGDCVSVCPTGALQREEESLESLTYQAQLYRGSIPILHAHTHAQEVITALQASPNPYALPFVLGQPHILNATSLLSIVQESGANVIVYAQPSSYVREGVDSLNALCEVVFGTKCVLLAHDEEGLRACLQEARVLDSLHYTYTPRADEGAKEIFSQRAYAWVRGGEFGRVSMQHSGNVVIDSQKCTLCLSCVDACHTKALVSEGSSFSLLFKQSLCTGCGYCADTCAEQVIRIESHVLDARSSSFEYAQKAYDEPFKCVECGKVFASAKSIRKIEEILLPSIGSDPIKQRGLQCCGDCKIKLIFGPKDHT
ncbi:4Fe-4S binding protein [uncultured Helicobacter sp.]|uniref:4Fe-4S binding protein n=1 Tax=uncultured Helicobacter sp. TaxID=175537 RepID=UPI00374E7CFC